MSQLILFNKPYQVLSQFTTKDDKASLAQFIVRPNVYPAGRLDYDSEGLLLLTDDGALQARISDPKFKLPKTYWVQVEGEPSAQAIKQLQQGITLNDGPTLPAKVRLITEPTIWPRANPVRIRANIPTRWLELTITEGRNRQVRRMTAHVGHPTLRLIRVKIGPWSVEQLKPGEHKTLNVHMDNKPATGAKHTHSPRPSRSKQRSKSHTKSHRVRAKTPRRGSSR